MSLFPRPRSSRPARRREDDGVAGVEFQLDGLEFVCATDEVGLLRVSGRWFAPASRVLDEVVLFVARGPETTAHRPLPAPDGVAPIASPTGGEWHGAFTMSAELAEHPRAEFFLRAGDAHMELPRPGEWQGVAEPEEVGTAPEPEEVGTAPMPEEAAAAAEPEAAGTASMPEERMELAEELSDPSPELEMLRAQLQEARTELEVERRRRTSMADELNSHMAIEEDLRKALAMQEAELASAVQQASQKALAAERRHQLVSDSGGHPAGGRSRPADSEFLARLDRAKRASETVA
jgi:hypothetical protein